MQVSSRRPLKLPSACAAEYCARFEACRDEPLSPHLHMALIGSPQLDCGQRKHL